MNITDLLRHQDYGSLEEALDESCICMALVIANEARIGDELPLVDFIRQGVGRARRETHYSPELRALAALFLAPLARNESECWSALLDVDAHAEGYFDHGPRRAEALLIKAELLRLAGAPMEEVLAVARGAHAEIVPFREESPEISDNAGINLLAYLAMAGEIQQAGVILDAHPWAECWGAQVPADVTASRLAAEGYLRGVTGDVAGSVSRLGRALDLIPDRVLPRVGCRCCLAEVAYLAGDREGARQQIRNATDLLARKGYFDLTQVLGLKERKLLSGGYGDERGAFYADLRMTGGPTRCVLDGIKWQ